MISIAPCLTDKDEHTALYKINKKMFSFGSVMLQAVYQVCANVFVFKKEGGGQIFTCACRQTRTFFNTTDNWKRVTSRILLTFFFPFESERVTLVRDVTVYILLCCVCAEGLLPFTWVLPSLQVTAQYKSPSSLVSSAIPVWVQFIDTFTHDSTQLSNMVFEALYDTQAPWKSSLLHKVPWPSLSSWQ